MPHKSFRLVSNVILIFLIVIINPHLLFSQKEHNVWYFGHNCGVTFNTPDGKPVALTDGQIDTWEGCSSICDESGNLLFYSNGVKAWNRNHQVMPNGDNLLGHGSSRHSTGPADARE